MARIIGIDLGSHAVKLAVFQGAFGRFEIEEYLSQPVPHDGDNPGSIPARLECLEHLMLGLPTDDRFTMGAAFPTERTSVRVVTLPFTDKTQIQQTLGFEVEGQVPFDLEDMVLTHRLLDSGPEGSRVLAALTPREQLGELLSSLAESDADPKSMVIDGDVLGDFATAGVEAVVDIGHQRTLVTICQNGRVWGTRAISMGGADLTAALMDAHQISWAEAETRKHAASLQQVQPTATPAVAEWEDNDITQSATVESAAPPVHPPATGQDGAIVRAALEPLLSSLRATLINFEDATSLDIDRVLLSGGTANLGGLESLLKVDLGVGVRRLTVSDTAHATGQPSRFGLAHAVANRAAGMSSGEEMELRTGDFKFRGDLANLRTAALWGSAGVVALMVLGVALFAWKWVGYNKQLDDLDAQIAEVVVTVYGDELTADDISGPEDALTKLQLKTMETMTRIEALGSIVQDEPPVVGVLHDLSMAMPKPSDARIDVRELTVTPNSVNMDAETDSYDAAATIEKSVSQHERFSGVKKSDEKKVREGIRFSLSIPLNTDTTATTEEG